MKIQSRFLASRHSISKRLSTAFVILALSLTALPLACVTVNVNFPESAVQKETDDFVRDLYRAKEKGRGTSASTKTTWNLGFSLIHEAYADGVFKVNTDKALQIRDRLASRLDDILAQKRAGVLGENSDGFVVVKDTDKLKKLLAQKVEKLVADENSDRTELYQEIVRSNGLEKARLKDIQKSFSRSFQAESPSGTWVQDSDGKWQQKP